MSQSIPINTVLGERYKVVASIIETADGDAVLEGKDQVLSRKVSIVVAAPVHNQRLISNARELATSHRATVQILDLGNSDGRTYLVTSHARADALLDRLLTDTNELKAASESKEALGEEIFGDTATNTSALGYQQMRESESEAAISATRDLGSEDDELAAGPAAETASAAEVYDDYDDEYEEEDSKGSPWIIALAAVILLVIGAAAVYSSLNGMAKGGSTEAGSQSSTSASASAASEEASSSPSPSASATTTQVKPEFTSVSRIVESNQSLMADLDGTLSRMIDGNTNTQWMTYGFGSADFGGLTDSFALSYELEEATKISTLTINQISGTGGAFTVYTNDTNSLNGATKVGSGSFTSAQVKVSLDTGKQSDDTKYVIVEFTEAPKLSQPIVSNYTYGARISEVSASN